MSQLCPGVFSGGAVAFNPASVFGAGDTGYAIDPTSSANIWQNSARSTAVTAVNDPIGGITDLSGKGKHFAIHTATQSGRTAAAWKTLGGINCVQGDGSTSLLESGAFTKDPSTGWTRIAALYFPTDPAALVIGDGAASGAFNTGMLQFGGQGARQLSFYDGTMLTDPTARATGTWMVVTEIHHGASSSLRVNLGTAVTGDAGTTTCSGTTICGGIFTGNVTTGYGRMLEITRVLSDTNANELTNAIKWAGAGSGLVL